MSDATMQRDGRAMRGAAQAEAGNRTLDAAMNAAGRAGQGMATTERGMEGALSAGMAWWDLMLRMQRASLASFSVYSPGQETRISGSVPQPQAGAAAGTAVIPVGEERLNVATRTVLGETTRIRRRVVAMPVEQEVTLREERVVVERRPAPPQTAAATPGGITTTPRGEVLTETVIEMSDSRQVPQVWKSVHVAEEVVLRREVTERRARVQETLRRDVVEVEHDREGRTEITATAEAVHGSAATRAIPARDEAWRRPEADSARRHAETEEAATRERLEAQAEAARERTEALAEAARQATIAGAADHAAAPGRQREGQPPHDATAEARRDAGPQDRKAAAPVGPQPGTAPRKSGA